MEPKRDWQPYPADLNAIHPFEEQIGGGGLKRRIKKDIQFGLSLFFYLEEHQLFRSELLADRQLDFMLDTYSATRIRIGWMIAEAVGNSNTDWIKTIYKEGNKFRDEALNTYPEVERLLAHIGWEGEPLPENYPRLLTWQRKS